MKKVLIAVLLSSLLLVGCDSKKVSVSKDDVIASQARMFETYAIVNKDNVYSLYSTIDSENYTKLFDFGENEYAETDVIFVNDKDIYVFTDGDLHNKGIIKYNSKGEKKVSTTDVYSANIIYGVVDDMLYFTYNTRDGEVKYAKITTDLSTLTELSSEQDLPSSIIG